MLATSNAPVLVVVMGANVEDHIELATVELADDFLLVTRVTWVLSHSNSDQCSLARHMAAAAAAEAELIFHARARAHTGRQTEGYRWRTSSMGTPIEAGG